MQNHIKEGMGTTVLKIDSTFLDFFENLETNMEDVELCHWEQKTIIQKT